MTGFDRDIPEAVALRDGGKGSNLLIAMKLYEAGGGTTESLSGDWDLDERERKLFMQQVKQGWAEGRWEERRVQTERRTP